MASVRVRINETELRRLTTSRSREVVRHADKIGRRTVNAAKRRAPVDDGVGRTSIDHVIEIGSGRIILRAGSPLQYMYWQDIGTGIYGPKRKPIVPVHRKFLRFEVKSGTAAKGSRPVVFARSVKGVKPTRWLRDAFQEACPYPVRERKI
ncbi:hypothetical protein [Nonomuraea sp. NEAU-A123]|uniref:hypothetical protein n=1 Tax=Nonomuraea sp. NEAU-A123 TaxID=2839649 RepID=UPI001BE4E138|nr:hypothetical protein [Nonomuraea sp. NEAU-A123]MBT2226246.1 hypothetical protein [Nonomuraea sp. NEAU-A123]